MRARQTEQSIRLGMWMDWNDPDELRRLGDLLGADAAQVTTIQGPDGPVTDSVEMLVGRLGMPDLGGSYFTFSNENNDLIWGFLAECHRRGWLYKGHDTMPWCARCGTGLSQTELNEGYQDKDDPGLTIRLPLLDRPGQALLVWTTTPWTLTSNVAAAVGSSLRYVRVRQGEDEFWLGKGTLALGARRDRSRCSRRSPGRTWSAGATPGRSTTSRRSARRSPPALGTRPTGRTSIGSCRGPRSARTRARASSTSPRAAAPRTSSSASRSACRSSRRSTSRGSSWTASGRCPAATSATWPSRSSSTSSARAASTGSRRSPTATRIAGGAGRRSSSASWTSGTSAWARSTTSRARRSRPSRSMPACATRSWMSWTGSGGSRTSAMSVSSTGSATCTTG